MNSTQHCPLCGASITPQAVGGLCPKCLLLRGLLTTLHGDPATFVPLEPQELAALFPELEIQEVLGHGGMGVVYKARQPRLDRAVALKILPVHLDTEPSFRDRFLQEARALAKLSHPGIVRVYDSGEIQGMHYLLMEFVEGVDLAKRLRAGRLSPEEALSIVRQVCEALDYAHSRGVVHRDIKPANILVTPEGRVKLADFGVAKLLQPAPGDAHLTLEGDALGTPLYMAPEQREKPEGVDERADLYSLGVVFYEMLMGELPTGSFPRPSERGLSPQLDEPVLHALENEPARRYQHASELRSAVEHLSTLTTYGGEGAVSRPGPRHQKRLWRLATTAMAMVAVVGLLGAWWWRGRKPVAHDIFEAAHQGDVRALRKFLDAGVDVNGRDTEGNTPLIRAALACQPEAMEFLLERKARPDVGDTVGLAPISQVMLSAPLRGSEASRAVELLLSHGANIHGTSEDSAPDLGVRDRVGPRPVRLPPFYLQPITYAVMQADADMVRLLIEHGADVRRKSGSGSCLLHHVASLGGFDTRKANSAVLESFRRKPYMREHLAAGEASAAVIRARDVTPVLALLLEQGLDIEAKEDDLLMSPLNVAAFEGRTNAVKALLDRGANLESTDKAKFTPLLSAVEKGHLDVVELLIARGASLQALDSRNSNALAAVVDKIRPDDTSLRLAALLLDKGMDVEVSGNKGMPPLMAAARIGHGRMVQLLLERGAKVGASLDLPGSSDDGTTALHWACFGPETWKRQAPPVPSTTPGFGQAILPCGSVAEYLECIKRLLDAGADPKARTVLEATPLHSAAQGNVTALVELLLDRGAEIEAADSQSHTPLMWAARGDCTEAVRALLKRGAKQMMPAGDTTALHLAASAGHTEVIEALVAAGADVNAFDEKGATPLHLACHQRLENVVRLLISLGADVNAEDAARSTPLEQSAFVGHRATVDILLAANADTAHIGLNGLTPSLAAEMAGHKELAEHLRSQTKGSDAELDRRRVENLRQIMKLVQLTPARVMPGAEALVRDEIGILEMLVGDPLHPALVGMRGILGVIHYKTGKPAEAVPLLQGMVKMLGATPKYRRSFTHPLYLRLLADACAAAARPEDQLAALVELRSSLLRGVNVASQFNGFTIITSGGQKPKPDALAIAELDRETAGVLIALRRPAEAEPLYRRAADVLRKAHGDDHSSVVAIQDALEKLSRTAGRPVRPQHVGGFAGIEKLLFEGNTTFSAETLHKGLLCSPDFLLAAHPSERFEDYLLSVTDCLKRGHQKAGFPDVKVTANYDMQRDVVVARINEGQRYRWGTLRIIGAEKTGNEALLQHLLNTKKPAPTFASRMSHLMANEMVGLQQEKGDSDSNLPLIGSDASFSDSWKTGKFASFGEQAESGLAGAAAQGLVGLGYFQPQVKARHTLLPETLTVDTVLEITEGPRAVLKRIEITGNKRFTREALLGFLDLREGMEMRPTVKEDVEDKITRCLRFSRWLIRPMQAAVGSPDMVLRLQLEELPGAPPLDQPLTRDQEEFVKVAEWITMLDQTGQTLEAGLLENNDRSTPLRLVWSKDGILVDVNPSGDKFPIGHLPLKRFAFSLVEGSITALLDQGETRRVWNSPVSDWRMEPSLGMISRVEESSSSGSSGSIFFGFGWRSVLAGEPPLQLQLCVAPTEVFRMTQLPGATVTREILDGDEILTIQNHLATFSWSPNRQKLAVKLASSSAGLQFMVRSADTKAWEDVHAGMKSSAAGATDVDARLSDWANLIWLASDLFDKVTGSGSAEDNTPEKKTVEAEADNWFTREKLEAWLVLADLLGDVGVDWSGLLPSMGTGEFDIPWKFEEGVTVNATSALVANVWFTFTDAYFPRDTWLWELGRELFYVQAGRMEHTIPVLNRIAQDPTLGPYGCLLAEKLLAQFKVPESRAFRQLALTKLSPEDFQKDWILLMETPSGMRDLAAKGLTGLAALEDVRLGKLTSLMRTEIEPLLRGAVTQLRANPDQRPAALLWPAVRKLWAERLEKELRTSPEQMPGVKAADPALIAARVNGIDITRADVRDSVSTQTADLRTEYESDPGVLAQKLAKLEAEAVDTLIERELVLQAFQKAGGRIKPEHLDEDIRSMVRENFASEDAFLAELRRFGMTLETFREQRRKGIIVQAMREEVVSKVKSPTESEARALYDKEAVDGKGTRRVDLHTLSISKYPVNDAKATPETQRRLAENIRTKIAAGAGFESMAKTYSQDSRAERGGCLGVIDPDELAEAMRDAVAGLKQGQMSDVIDVGVVYVLLWVKREAAREPPRPFAELSKELTQRIKQTKDKEAINKWLAQLRMTSHIEKFAPEGGEPSKPKAAKVVAPQAEPSNAANGGSSLKRAETKTPPNLEENIHIEGLETHYDPSSGIATAKGGAESRYGNLRMTCDELAYDARSGDVTGKGAVRVTVGEKSWEGSEIRYNLKSGTMTVTRIDETTHSETVPAKPGEKAADKPDAPAVR